MGEWLTDLDYEAYLIRIQAATFEEAVYGSGVAPAPRSAMVGQAPASSPSATDYFAFYKENGRWAWRRVAASGAIVAASSYTFRYYLECTVDAKQHGWPGTPWCLLAGSALQG
jgi:hypothetical protein